MSILASGCADMGASVTLVVLRGGKKVYPVSEKVNIIQFKNCGKFSAIIRVVKLHKVLKSTNTDAVIPFLPIISLYTSSTVPLPIII